MENLDQFKEVIRKYKEDRIDYRKDMQSKTRKMMEQVYSMLNNNMVRTQEALSINLDTSRRNVGEILAKMEKIPRYKEKIEEYRDLAETRPELGYKRYFNKKGHICETLFKPIIEDYAEKKDSNLIKNFKFDDNKRLEYVLVKENIINNEIKSEKIGIDITTAHTINAVEEKWQVRKYNENLDKLFIIVVSNRWDQDQYQKINESTPHNVKVMHWTDFVSESELIIDKKLEKKLNFIENNKFGTVKSLIKELNKIDKQRNLDKYLN